VNYLEFIVGILQALAWPLSLVVIIYLLQDDFRAALTRVEKAKFPGGAEFAFGTLESDVVIGDSTTNKPIPSIDAEYQLKNNKIANIYWLGSDIMWTVDMLLRKGPEKNIRHGLLQIQHHCNEIGLDHPEIRSGISEMLDTVQDLNYKLLPSYRKTMAVKLVAINDQVGQIAETNQDKFSPGWAEHPLDAGKPEISN